MRRRTLLSGLALPLCGCLGSPGVSGSNATTTTTNTTPTTPVCSTVQPDFDLPDVSNPGPLNERTARDVALRIERAYVDHLGVSPATFEDIGDDVDSFTFSVSRARASEAADGEGYRVEVVAMARYSYDGDEQNQTQYHADRPMDAGTYRVTDRTVARVAAGVVGDLTGTLVCW